MKNRSVLAGTLAIALLTGCTSTKNIVIIAGKPSHPEGMHEFRAGSLLLQKCLSEVKGVSVTVYSNGWPNVSNALDKADAVVIYADGGSRNPVIQGDHKRVLAALSRKGVGLGFIHNALAAATNGMAHNGGAELMLWIGGYYADRYSVNPLWSPEFKKFPKHSIANGVQPFSTRDEWYLNPMLMFNTVDGSRLLGLLGLAPPVPIPILVAKPSDELRKGPYVHRRGPYYVGSDELMMMWAWERSGGGRGFGFGGGHTHANWGDDNQRKVVLNALLWIAKAKVPGHGVESVVSPEDLQQNLDPKKK